MIIFFVAIVGLCLGSFVNALVWRTRKVLQAKKGQDTSNYSILRGRSRCTHCGYELKPKDLVPVLSYLMLRGKCRSCHKSIDDKPYAELAVAILAVLSYVVWPYDFDKAGIIKFVIWLPVLAYLVAMVIYDYKWMQLPNRMTYTVAGLAAVQLVALLIAGNMHVRGLEATALSVLVGGGLFDLIYRFSNGKYIGGGDVKLGYAYGLLLADPIKSWLVLTIASLVGTAWAVYLVVSKKASFKSRLSFGPFLIAGLIIVVLFGGRVWNLFSTGF